MKNKIRRSMFERPWIAYSLLAFILILAAYLRLTGINWDADQHLHPDERFLTGVEASLASVSSLGEYFDTANSSLNPNNRGHHFFVYGTFPIFLVRYAAEWVGQTGFDQIQLIGRALSALADLGVVTLVYAIASLLFNRRAGLLAALFSTLTVVQIQQSHYWTVDNFTNLFSYLAIYFALRIAVREKNEDVERSKDIATWDFNPFDFLYFGIALGLAVSSKISAAPVAFLLPLAVLVSFKRKKADQRNQLFSQAALHIFGAAIISLVVFRIFQPYAFSGPGFFNLSLNPQWLDTLRQLSGQVSGDVDWPPSMQWARRPVWFAFQHMTLWGMGLPLAIIAWGAFAWIGWRFYKTGWLKPELLLWLWGLTYFLWQSTAFNPTMRYLLPVYPALAVFAGFALVRLWEWGGEKPKKSAPRWQPWAKSIAFSLGVTALIGSLFWAFAFVQIYRNPITRIDATAWIYQNVPGPITLHIDGELETFHQPIPFGRNNVIQADSSYFFSASINESGRLNEIYLHQIIAPIRLELSRNQDEASEILQVVNEFVNWADISSGGASIIMPLAVDRPGNYQININLPSGEGGILLERMVLQHSQDTDGIRLPVVQDPQFIEMGSQQNFSFLIDEAFFPDQLLLEFRADDAFTLDNVGLNIRISDSPDLINILGESQLAGKVMLDPTEAPVPQIFQFQTAIHVAEDQIIYFEITSQSSDPITLLGSAVANESSWDDGLPRRMFGYDGFGGIYQGDLNFEMYWDENAEKLERFTDILDRSAYIFISSSRQWASLPRIPERFPLASLYYRQLIGCPDSLSIEKCYNDAQVGDYQGSLGFELIGVFESSPQIGSIKINDQAAEEAFTVYDHPKVFIFKKSDRYQSAEVRAILSIINFDTVQHITPKQASSSPEPNLALPASNFEQQRNGGTWSELFDVDSFVNASPWVSVIVWYLALSFLGIAIFPLVQKALPGLKDGGFPFARLSALMLLAYFSWLGASLGLSFSRAWLLFFALVLSAIGIMIAFRNKEKFILWLKENKQQIIRTELLFLGFFLIMLLIRLGNADLWHPGKGGEKPMDFAYFNAVLKSTSFPAFDPWFSGGYINYYYYGFVLVGSLTKLLGIVPSVAYNLILPTLFAMLAMGAYSIAWNIFTLSKGRKKTKISSNMAGIAAAVSMVLLGNLGSLQMIFLAFQRMGAQGAYSVESGFLTKLLWAARGFLSNLLGESLPIGLGDWYWNPTRIIPAPGETMPITEFPLFTFTYADLHAHMIALPITLLAIAWGLSVILNKAWKGKKNYFWILWSVLFAAITIGSLRPSNTWDFPTYLALGMTAIGYAVWRYWPRKKGEEGKIWIWVAGSAALLAGLSVLTYQPYADWYRQGFTSMELWRGTHTPTGIYLIHWGLFLFFILAWMAWETRQWLAQTPLSSLRKLQPYGSAIIGGLLTILLALFALASIDVAIGWLVLPLMIWTGLLMLRPGQNEMKRIVLFLIGTGLFITLMVEVIVLRGDISRMNTVFKFYMQVWVLFGISAALSLAWILGELKHWLRGWQRIWQSMAVLLVASTSLFLLLGVSAKMQDRMSQDSPRTLDGLTYMQYAIYYDRDQELQLNQDYEAIRWLQDHVKGSPVIVEAHTGEYRWGSRISINTGLPAVIGWNWHQRQQREFVPGNDIWGRVGDVQQFYESGEFIVAHDFLDKYQVEYIIVGQLEQAYYPESGLAKFENLDGLLWDEVFHFEDTRIYQVKND